MKNQTFVSSLSKEEIMGRIKLRARSYKSGYRGDCCVYRIYDERRFWLMKPLQNWFGTYVGLSFCAEITVDEESENSIISGCFAQTPEGKRMLIAFELLAPILILLMGGVSFAGFALLFLALGILLEYLLFYWMPKLICHRQHREVIAFIEKNLLS